VPVQAMLSRPEENPMNKERLTAFSDGAIAIVPL